jgi:hypothetical protein
LAVLAEDEFQLSTLDAFGHDELAAFTGTLKETLVGSHEVSSPILAHPDDVGTPVDSAAWSPVGRRTRSRLVSLGWATRHNNGSTGMGGVRHGDLGSAGRLRVSAVA